MGIQAHRTLATLRADVYEEWNMLVIEAELPGLQPEDIELTVDSQVLEIRAAPHEFTTDRSYRRRERGFGPVCREIPLPVAVRREQVEATLCDGVLLVRMPMSGEQAGSLRRRVPVGRGPAGSGGAGASGEQDS